MKIYINCKKCNKKMPKIKASLSKQGEYHCFDCIMQLFIKDYNLKK